MSRSKLGKTEPCATAADPPMTTKSTRRLRSVSRIAFGLSSTGTCRAEVSSHEVREGHSVVETLVWRHRERRVVQGAIESVILLAGRHAEPLAHQVKEPGEHVDRG